MEKIYVKNISEFINAVLLKVENLQIEQEGTIWFRGEDSEHYTLTPNLFRKIDRSSESYCLDILNPKDVDRIEQNIDVDFSRKASMFFGNKRIENTHWNRYFLKQHYGIYTRLLDWTESALIALFFSVQNTSSDKNGKVWVLSPYKLNTYSVSKLLNIPDRKFYSILTCGELGEKGSITNKDGELRIPQLLRKYYRMNCDEDEKMFPLAIYPTHLDERMAAQQACFTIFGNMVNGLDCDDAKEQFVDCIYVDGASKARILRELRILGISNYSIYPDLDGLGKTINYDRSRELIQVQSNNDLKDFLKYM